MNYVDNPSDIDIAKHVVRLGQSITRNPSIHGYLRYLEDSINEAIKIAQLCESKDFEYTHNLLALLSRIQYAQNNHKSDLGICIEYEIKRHKLYGIL